MKAHTNTPKLNLEKTLKYTPIPKVCLARPRTALSFQVAI